MLERPPTVRTLAAHEIVQRLYPRPVTERDERAMAVGKAIDEGLADYSYGLAQGRRPTVSAAVRFAEEVLRGALSDAHLPLEAPDLAAFRRTITESVRLFRRSELAGLPRPRSRLILIGGDAGVYAQPDFWDRRGRIYELKSYRADPPSPEVRLQLELYQLAFPDFQELLVSLDRHADPVTLTVTPVAPVAPTRKQELLATARALARAHGVGKVLRYVETPVVRYDAPPGEPREPGPEPSLPPGEPTRTASER